MSFIRTVKTLALSACGVAVLIQPVLAASTCATDTDLAAFRTAAVAQQLMVAALTCKDVEAYNRFVLAYRPELQKSDADLKAYFVRGGSEAAYDTFKTKLANLSSLSDIANGPAYCSNAAAAFDMARKNRQSLDSFVADQRLMIALPQQTLCTAPKPVEIEAAAAKPAPVRLAEAKAVPVNLTAAKSAPPVKLAAAAPQTAPDTEPTVSVPAHALPASPFGGASAPAAAKASPAPEIAEARSAPGAYDNAAYDRAPDSDEAGLPLPPRPPRTLEASRREAYYAAQYAQDGRYAARPDSDPYYYEGR